MRRLTLAALLVLSLQRAMPARAQTAADTPDGNPYVVQVLKNLSKHGNIDAKLRFESHLYDQLLVGQGAFQQRGELSKRYTRWEMHTQIADRSASYLQVYDGTHLWTERRLPSRRQVNRLDVARLQTGLRNVQRGTRASNRDELLLSVAGQGGLGQMLSDLLRNYDFQPPQATQLDGLPVYALVGTWREEQLAKHWPASVKLQSAEPPDWPGQLPHHVLLMVYQQNLFPCVIEFRSADGSQYSTSLSGLRTVDDPLMRYEIHEINFAVAIANERFQFNPGDRWSDETSLVLEEMTKELQPVEEAHGAKESIRR